MAPKNTKSGDGEKPAPGRGEYNCNKGQGQCGEKLKGHVCAYEPKYRLLRPPSEKPLETKTAAVQANRDERMTLARMKPSFYIHTRANEADEISKVAQKQESKKPDSELKTEDGRC